MRVIGGHLRGRKLVQVEGCRIRPTSDRTREAVFNILGPRVRHARILDLYAGTGAMGIEALSRGADYAVFMDLACDTLNRNLILCRLMEKATVIVRDIVRDPWPLIPHLQNFDIVFIDPPYNQGYIEKTIEKEGFTNLLAPNGWILAEHSHKETLQIQRPGLDIFRQKKYSKTIVSFITRAQTQG